MYALTSLPDIACYHPLHDRASARPRSLQRAAPLRYATVEARFLGRRGAVRFGSGGWLVPALVALAATALPAAAAGPSRSLTVPLPPPQKALAPEISGPRGKDRPLVVIDPGHGGHDPGTISAYEGRQEKDAVLAIGRAIRDELVKSGRVRVAMTRADDRFLALPERVAVARRLNADLFISIHADSAPNPTAAGASVYTLSEVASDKEAARLAAKENKSDIIKGIDLGAETADIQSILIDLAQRETMNASATFANVLQRETAPAVRFRSVFHRFANFRVLKAPDTPSVLLETGYLSNLDDAHFLFSAEGREAIATGVRRAVEAHFARRLAERRPND